MDNNYRLHFSNKAINFLKEARANKDKLMNLDKDLLTLRVMMRTKSEFEKEIDLQNKRKAVINNIVNNVQSSIINAITALKSSINNKNNAMIKLDDFFIQNIVNFINEYYKTDEIKNKISNELVILSSLLKLDFIISPIPLSGLTNLIEISNIKTPI